MWRKIQGIFRNDFFKNVATLVTGSSISQLVALLIYPILTDIYTPEEHGLFSLYMSIIAITGILSTGRYQMAVLMPKTDKKAMNLIALGLLIAVCVSLLLLFLVLVFHENLAVVFNNPGIEKWLFFIPLSTFLIGFFELSIWWHNRQKKFRDTAGANLSQSLTNSTVKITTSKLLSNGGGLITGAIVGQVIGATYFMISWLRRFRLSFRDVSFGEMRIVAREYYRFPVFNMPNNLINNVSNSLPIFLLGIYFSATEVGFYGLAFAMVFRPMNLVVRSMEQVFSQRMISRYNEGLPVRSEFRLLVARSFQIAIVPFVLAGVFAPVIFRVVFGEEWEEAGRYMQLLLPWFFVAFVGNQLTFIPDLFSRQKTAMILNIIRLLLRIVGMGIGIWQNDLYLTLILFSGVSTLMVIVTLVWYDRLIKRETP